MLLSATCMISVVSCGKTDETPSGSSNADTPSSASGASAAAPTSGGDTVKIGFVWPLTGGSATIGQQHNDGANYAIEMVNRAGGIQSLGKKVEAVVADSETKPDIGANQTERLITKDQVTLLVGAYNSTVCFAASEVAQRYQVPWISMGGVQDQVTERGYEYVYRVNNKATYDVEEMLKGLDLVEAENHVQVQTYALIYESTDWGSDNAKIWKSFADQRGWKCVVDEPVTVGTADLSPQINKIKEANPDVVNVSFYTPEMIVFSETMFANRVNPQFGVWSVGGGSQDPAYRAAIGSEYYEYNFVQEDWNVSAPDLYPWIGEIAKDVEAKYGYPLNSFFAQGYTAAMVAIQALEHAGSTEAPDILKALKEMDIQMSDPDQRIIMTGYPRIKFDENGQNTYSTGTIIQYQKGQPVAFSPAEHRTPGSKAILPLPDDFDTRGK